DVPDIAEKVRGLAQQMLGVTIARTRCNSPRLLLPYRAAEGSPGKRTLAGELGKIEVLGHGQQFVAYGCHPSGAALVWQPAGPAEFSRCEHPAVSEEQIGSFLDVAGELIRAAKPCLP